MNIAIVKYNAGGNTRSVLCALHRLGYEAKVLMTQESWQMLTR